MTQPPNIAALVKYLRAEAENNLRERQAFNRHFGSRTGGAHFVKRARKLRQAADCIASLEAEKAALQGEVERLRKLTSSAATALVAADRDANWSDGLELAEILRREGGAS